jgi:hypothetical protein
MKIKSAFTKAILASTAVIGLMGIPQNADATIVATIDGCYDCIVYDTPSLTFHNTSGGAFTNAMLLLEAYQPGTLNFGDSQLVSLGTLPTGNTNYNWGGATIPHNLAAYDYDDEWGNNPPDIPIRLAWSRPACVRRSGTSA